MVLSEVPVSTGRETPPVLEEAESPQAMADGRPVTERLYVS